MRLTPHAALQFATATVAVTAAKAVGPIVFDRQYLRGRWFDRSGDGWRWVLHGILWQKLLRINWYVPWPVSPQVMITDPNNISFHPDDIQNFQSPGVYWANGLGRIELGRGSYVAPGVGLIAANHDPANPDRHTPGRDIVIGDHCWIGMNAVILPGVVLGPYTSVGANATVTHSFPEGFCVLAGSPAKVIRRFGP